MFWRHANIWIICREKSKMITDIDKEEIEEEGQSGPFDGKIEEEEREIEKTSCNIKFNSFSSRTFDPKEESEQTPESKCKTIG